MKMNSDLINIGFKSLVVCLALSPLLYSQYTPYSGPAQELSTRWFSTDIPWEVLALIAVLISFSFSAISYMIAKLFQSEDIEKLAKAEFMYAVSTVILIAFLIIIVDILATKSSELVLILSRNNQNLYNLISSNPSPFIATEYYLNASLFCLISRYQEAFCLDIGPATASSILSTSWHNALVRVMSDFTYLIYLFFFQKNLLSFINDTMLVIVLPIGIVIRGFPFVRSVGNTLIAVAIGLYFVYPISYSLLMAILSQSNIVTSNCFINYNVITFYAAISNYASLPCLSPILKEVVQDASLFYTKAKSQDYNLISAFVDTSKQLIGEIIMFAVVFPFVAATLTYTFIKSFAVFLNVDAQDMLEGLVKLI
jgi:hypothetical protein